MPDNVTVTEATSGDAPPPRSASNWPGDQPAAVAPPAQAAETGGDAPKTPADGGTPPAAIETPPAEGEGGEAGAGDTPAAEGGEGGEAGAGEGEGTAAAAKPDKSLSGKLGQRTRERNEVRAERDQLAVLLEKAIDRLGEGGAAKPAVGEPPVPGAPDAPPAVREAPDPRPRRDGFEDPDAYDEAVDQWSLRQSRKMVTAEIARQETERQANAEKTQRAESNRAFHDQRVTVWNDRVAELKKNDATADFEARAYSQEVQVTPAMSAMLLTLDKGPDVLLYLADHPDEAEKIAKLTAKPGEAGFNPQVAFAELYGIQRDLGRARPQVSKAPAPIRPIGNSNRAAPKSPDEESMAEYAARRNPEIAATRTATMFGNRRA